MKSPDPKKILAGVFRSAIAAVDPYHATARYCAEIERCFRRGGFKKLFVTGFGKASYAMARAITDDLGGLVTSGAIITKYGRCGPGVFDEEDRGLQNVDVYEAGHPVPDEEGVQATDRIVDIMRRCDKDTMMVCLVSGGGSALLVRPSKGLSLRDKQLMTNLLLQAGATTDDFNTVRKHMSGVKGGRLAGLAYPAQTISLVLSDVAGDRLDAVASGPTLPDRTTYIDALTVLEKLGLLEHAPKNILELFHKGTLGALPDTPKEQDRVFENVANIIIAGNRLAVEAADTKARSLGYPTHVMTTKLAGETREAARALAGEALAIKRQRRGSKDNPLLLISAGETSVTVKGRGTGGRNTEFGLAFALEIDGADGITLLSSATDGTDGPTDASGAIVDGLTAAAARGMGVDPVKFLMNNDSYSFFKRCGGLFITGPAGTNAMDMQLVLIQ